MPLFGRRTPDPTASWGDEAPPALRLELEPGTLNGAPIGGPFDAVAFLGRPSNRQPIKDERLCYPSLGLEIDLQNGMIDTINCGFRRSSSSALTGCTVELVLGDRVVQADASSTIESLVAVLGAPAAAQEADEELVVRFDIGPVTLELEAASDGRVRRAAVFSETA